MPKFRGLDVHHYVRYRTSIDSTWTNEHHTARQWVRAVKGRDFKGYAWVDVNGTPKKFDASNAAEAARWAGEILARRIAADHPVAPVALVPIPSSKASIGLASAGPAGSLCATVAALVPSVRVADALRFRAPGPSASEEGGTRISREIFESLVVDPHALAGNGVVVLVDDVLASGGHMLGAMRAIEATGAKVISGIVFGRSEDEVVTSFGWATERISGFW